MEEQEISFANRDELIPDLELEDDDDAALADEGVSASGDASADRSPNKTGARRFLHRSSLSMQDKVLEALLAKVIPTQTDENTGGNTEAMPNSLSSKSKSTSSRPDFNLPTMAANFRRFNSRIGVVFSFQGRMTRLLSWKQPTHTLSLLAVYTFLCLEPHLIPILPLLFLLLSLLIPAFIARHPSPPIPTSAFQFEYTPTGPPIAPAPVLRPVKELSKDFFRNMRDLQNSMGDFSNAHDALVDTINPAMNFSNEPLSSTIVLFLFVSCGILSLSSSYIPITPIALAVGWLAISSGHPKVARTLSRAHKKHVRPLGVPAKSWLDAWVARDIILDSVPETREVEIFELQRLSNALEWEVWLYATSPYTPRETGRLSGEGPKGTRFFEDVRPPPGWEWSGKKWCLDLWSREWVEERCVSGVEVETDGERWVWDLVDVKVDGRAELGVADGVSGRGKGREKEKEKMNGVGWKAGGGGAGLGGAQTALSWEEGTGSGNVYGRRGEWRRRRWVRLVQRRNLSKPGP